MKVIIFVAWPVVALLQAQTTNPGQFARMEIEYRTTGSDPVRTSSSASSTLNFDFPNTRSFSNVRVAVQAPASTPGGTPVRSGSNITGVLFSEPSQAFSMRVTGMALRNGSLSNLVGPSPCPAPSQGFSAAGGSLDIQSSCRITTTTLTALTAGGGYSAKVSFTAFFNDSGYYRVDIIYEFREGSADSIRIASVQPSPSQPVEAVANEFCADITAVLGTRDRAEYALRLYDQDDILVASTNFFPLLRSSGPINARRCTPATSPPELAEKLRLKAVIVDPLLARVIAESAVTEYTVAAGYRLTAEVVQTSQTQKNGVPLVGLRPTLVRVFVRQTGNSTAPVTGVLRRSDVPGGELKPMNGSILPKKDPSRDRLDDSLNFHHPYAAHNFPSVFFELRNAAGLPLGKTLEVPSPFQESIDPIRVALIPVCFQPPGLAEAKCPEMRMPHRLVDDLLPSHRPTRMLWTASKLTWKKPLQREANQRELTHHGRRIARQAGLPADQIALVLPDLARLRLDNGSPTDPGIAGQADPLWDTANSLGRSFWMQRAEEDVITANTMLHEMAHNFGLHHAGGNDFLDLCAAAEPVWPYSNTEIQDPGWRASLGTLQQSTMHDLMSNCASSSRVWVSPFTAAQLIKSGLQPQKDLGAVKPAAAPAERLAIPAEKGREATPVRQAVIQGVIRRDGAPVPLEPVSYITAENPDTGISTGTHCLDLQTAAGALPPFCFTPSFNRWETWGSGPPGMADETYFQFTIAVPDTLTRVALRRGSTQLAVRTASRTAPTVAFVTPSANTTIPEGNFTLAWRGQDTDSDPLTYAVDYSQDGTRWLPLEFATSATQLILATADLHPGPLRFRVTVTDGLRSAEGQLAGITLRQRPAIGVGSTSITVGSSLVGVPREITVPVTNTGTGPLIVRSAASNNAEFEMFGATEDGVIPVGGTAEFTLRFTPEREGMRTATVTLASNDVARPNLTVSVSGVGSSDPAPFAVVSPASLAFGSVSVGQNAAARLMIENRGSGTLRIESAASSDSQFAVRLPSFPAQIDEPVAVDVRFTPSASGTRAGRLTLRTNDPARPAIEIPLAGTGIANSTPAAGGPAIRLQTPVVQTFSGRADISSGTWIEIYGSNFSPRTRSWTGSDFRGGQGPTSLDGWGVMVNSRPAIVYFISPTQINAYVPEDSTTGPVPVQVTGPNNLRSNNLTVNKNTVTPSLHTHPAFRVGSTNYVVAVHPATNAASTIFVGRPNMFAGVATRTVRPGDIISLYAVGCGPAGGVRPGFLVDGENKLSLPHEIRIGGRTAFLTYDGYAPSAIGLVQFNIVVPNLSPGEYDIELVVDGVSNDQGLKILIG